MICKTVDILGMTKLEAKKRLEQTISATPPNCEITVIHGFHGGQALQNMLRKGLKHRRIKQRILSLNSGETVLVIE
ncbi:MAG: DNA mismatch repair protein MutS [Clostridiaceae bacterium]|jgi:DNA-nicking Smr family endonuclease|nr:DNA mismatch repair protein MutS [Clostridiaceae bacterium]